MGRLGVGDRLNQNSRQGIIFTEEYRKIKLDPRTLIPSSYNNLGKRVSHGCVRLQVIDAKWIFDNCPRGTKITIYNSSDPGPLGKPALQKIPGSQTWDPTDPAI